MKCDLNYDHEHVWAFATRRMPQAERESFVEHVNNCSQCAEDLERTRTLTSALARVDEDERLARIDAKVRAYTEQESPPPNSTAPEHPKNQEPTKAEEVFEDTNVRNERKLTRAIAKAYIEMEFPTRTLEFEACFDMIYSELPEKAGELLESELAGARFTSSSTDALALIQIIGPIRRLVTLMTPHLSKEKLESEQARLELEKVISDFRASGISAELLEFCRKYLIG